jgi:hypothetical protein
MFNGCVINYNLSYPRTHQIETPPFPKKTARNIFQHFQKTVLHQLFLEIFFWNV